jgi:diaminohydroxyphosphoribosylaminopyrimidine deaminase/5-amino-6-(5-phosphoribosylamino)uracil reductase
MRRALLLASDPSIRPGANPRVGCVLLSSSWRVLAEAAHLGAGTPHAETAALAAAGDRVDEVDTAVVTLEPCNHTGRTGPCAQALIDAGVRRVVYAVDDPTPQATGGAARLRAAGVDVVGGVLADEAVALDEEWFAAVRMGRPHVTWKVAGTLDGRVAAADRSSRWVSGPASRRDTHRVRGQVDAIVAGTGTVLADDSQLVARDGDDRPLPADRQPLRAVMGLREVPPDARVLDGSAPTVLLPTRDPKQALATLWDHGARRVLLEGGPTLAAAFWRAGLVDRVTFYLAPSLLGAGPTAVGDLGIPTISEQARLRFTAVEPCGNDLKITAVPVGGAGDEEDH